MTVDLKVQESPPLAGLFGDKYVEQSYLIDLIKTNKEKKDGASMCTLFAGMIDKTEQVYDCIVVCFCCDTMAGVKRVENNWFLLIHGCLARPAVLIKYVPNELPIYCLIQSI